MRTDTYWAAESEQRKFIARALDRVAWGLAALKASGRLELMRKMMSAYYGSGTDGTRDAARLQDAGEQGEITAMHVNKIRPIAQNVLSIVCAVRPAIKPVATNGDAASAAETRLAMALHEFYARKLDAGSQEEEAMRGALICSSFSLVQRWAPSAGAEVAYDVEDDRLTFEGDIEAFLLPPWRIFFEPTNGNEPRWCIFRRREPRHDLIARAKDEGLKEKLRSGATAQQSEHLFSRLVGGTVGGMTTQLEHLMGEDFRPEDEVWVWELRHLPTPALPMGRLVRFIEPDLVLFDSLAAGEPVPQEPGADENSAPIAQATRYPYEELHAYEISPERVVGTRQGHTLLFDLMGLQDFHDICTASIATTVNLMGTPHLWSPLGAAPQVHQLSTGPTVIETPQKPEVIDLPALKPEVVQAAEWASSLMNQSAALNDVVMGNPQKGMPASAQALQRAQAVQFHNAVQGEWIRLIGKNANGRLRILKRFARTERVAELAGSGGSWELRQWSRDDIAGVPRFEVEPINAMSATFEGRQSLAEQMGIVGDALFDFITTGSLKKVTETRTLQLELVERNKALLLRGIGLAPVDMQASMQSGQPVFADDGQEHVSILKSDPHHLAIPAYLSVVNSPEARADAALTQAALDCVTESQRLWASLTLDDCAAYGIPPLPSQAAPAMPAPGGPPGPQTGGGAPPAEGPPSPLPAPPESPQDPLTGESQDNAELGLSKDAIA